jgi:hypothetical protein
MDATSATPAPRSLWIARPSIDLLIGCGGWSLPLLAISYTLSGAAALQWSAAFYSLALVTNYPHYMATVYRAYGRRDRSANHLYIVWGTVLLVGLAALAHLDTALLPWLFTAYVMWSPWHYTGQNFGLMMMFLRRGDLEVTAIERRRLYAAFIASYLLLLAAFNEAGSSDPLVITLGLPPQATRVIESVAGLVFVAAGLSGLIPLARRAGRGRILAPAVLYLTQALWFVVPTALTWFLGLAVPQTRYSSGILAVMHSAQYLWITQYFARREQAQAWDANRYWLAVVIGGIALFLPIPWLASYVAHVDFTASMLIVTAVVNLHHFMLDGVVWKLRDPRVSRALTSTAEGPDAPSMKPAAPVWRNAIAATVVVALLALAGVDQWRYRLTTQTSNPDAVEAALRLNPYDGSTQLRLVGSHLERAEMLIAQGRTADALPHYRAFLELVVQHREQRPHPEVVIPAIIRFGEALEKTGHQAEAKTQFELAVRMAQQTGLRELETLARERLAPSQ